MLHSIKHKRNLQIYYSRFIFGAKIFFVLGFILLVITKKFDLITDLLTPKLSEALQDYGFELENVIITGQNNVQSQEILSTLNADRGTPIFSINLKKVQQSLEQNPWIKTAVIERKMPSTIILHIKEREPCAIWQVNKELFVVDQDGAVLNNISSTKYPSLIHVVGQDANIYASKLIENLNTNPRLAAKIVNAVRFGQRRWDLNLVENINVKMPQENFLEAYKYLSDLNKEGKLFGHKIKSLDLRDSNKIYIERDK